MLTFWIDRYYLISYKFDKFMINHANKWKNSKMMDIFIAWSLKYISVDNWLILQGKRRGPYKPPVEKKLTHALLAPF